MLQDIQNWTLTNVKSHAEPFKTGARTRDVFVDRILRINRCMPLYGNTSYSILICDNSLMKLFRDLKPISYGLWFDFTLVDVQFCIS